MLRIFAIVLFLCSFELLEGCPFYRLNGSIPAEISDPAATDDHLFFFSSGVSDAASLLVQDHYRDRWFGS